MPETVTVEGYEHPRGPKCDQCWSGFPWPCDRPGCDGSVHAEFFEEDWDNVYLTKLCDVCDA